MNKKKNNGIDYSKHTIWKTNEKNILPLVLAKKIMDSAERDNLLPSEIFGPAKISISGIKDEWTNFKFDNKHYLESSKIKKIRIHNNDFNIIKDSLRFFNEFYAYIPLIETDDISDWPYLFAAQLQVLAEQISLSPLEALMLFGVIYEGTIQDYWEELNWKYLITRKFTNVSLISGTKSFPKMN